MEKVERRRGLTAAPCLEVQTMKKYFVKAIFSGWHEASEENYNRFCDNIRRNATGIKSEEKEAYILTVTRIEETEI